jgi:hypothetical protein
MSLTVDALVCISKLDIAMCNACQYPNASGIPEDKSPISL